MKQPRPKSNDLPFAWDLVLKDIKKRDEFGKLKYGTRLQPFNGRDTLRDVYEELLDAVVYIRTLIWERETLAEGVHNSVRKFELTYQKLEDK